MGMMIRRTVARLRRAFGREAPEADHDHGRLLPGTVAYAEHIRGEIEHYAKIFEDGAGRESLLQPVPPAWNEAERRASALIRDATGNDLVGQLT